MKEENKWEITIMEIKNSKNRYKLTKRFPEYKISETKVFESKEQAVKQFNEWIEAH